MNYLDSLLTTNSPALVSERNFEALEDHLGYRVVPDSTVAGAPTADEHLTHELWIDSANDVWRCTAGGTPGTWDLYLPIDPVSRSRAATITGLWTFDRGTGNAPFAVGSGAGKVTGLDADLLDGYNSAAAATSSTIPVRDASGRMKAADPSADDDVATKLWTLSQIGTAGYGTVTSVAISAPAQFSVSGSPVTSAGTLALSWANQSANTVLSGPASGGAAAPTFRALVADDIPSLAASKTTSGVFDAARLGTGTANNTTYLRGDGTWQIPASGVTDHGLLTGLSDDDHTQYHNDTRGDARYSLLGHAHSGVYEPVFSKGDIVQGTGISLSGTLAGRLVGTGNVTIALGSHTHAIADTTGLQTALDGKSATTHNHSGVYEPVIAAGTASKFWSWDKTWRDLDWSLITSKPSTFTPASHDLDSHSDCTITTPSSGQFLKYNGSAWINSAHGLTYSDVGAAEFAHAHSGVYEPVFSKGDLASGANIALSGSLSGRLYGSGSVTVSLNGTVAVANGGTGAITLTGVLAGNGTSAVSAIAGTTNYIPKWSAVSPYLTATSMLYDDGTHVAIGTAPISGAVLDVAGTIASYATAPTMWFYDTTVGGSTPAGFRLDATVFTHYTGITSGTRNSLDIRVGDIVTSSSQVLVADSNAAVFMPRSLHIGAASGDPGDNSLQVDSLVGSGTRLVTTGSTGILSVAATSAFVLTLLDDSDAATFRASIGAESTLTKGNLTASGAISLSATRDVIGGAAAISHSTASGYKHIPSGGSSGQLLSWSSDGTAAWTTHSNHRGLGLYADTGDSAYNFFFNDSGVAVGYIRNTDTDVSSYVSAAPVVTWMSTKLMIDTKRATPLYLNSESGGAINAGGQLNLLSGTTTNAPLFMTSGSLLATPVAGGWEYASNLLYFTPSGTTRRRVMLEDSGTWSIGISGNAATATSATSATTAGTSSYLSSMGTSTGIAVQTSAGVWAARSIAAGTGISVTNGDGVSGNPTVALSTPVSIANGGTNATSFGTTNGLITYDGTKLAASSFWTASSTTLAGSGFSHWSVSITPNGGAAWNYASTGAASELFIGSTVSGGGTLNLGIGANGTSVIRCGTNTLAFFGTAAITKPSASATAASILTALSNLGLVTAV